MKAVPLTAYDHILLTVLVPSPFTPYLVEKCSLEHLMFFRPAVRPFYFASLAREVASEAITAGLEWSPFRQVLVDLASAADLPARYAEDVLDFASAAGHAHAAEWVIFARCYVYVRRDDSFVHISDGYRFSSKIFNGMWDEIRPDDSLGNMVDHLRSNALIVEVDTVTSHDLDQPSIEVATDGGILRLTEAAWQEYSWGQDG